MNRQPFNNFLNSPGPSTPRGRGGGRGGRGGRGGSSGVYGSAVGGGGSGKKDYSNVSFDYTQVNSQRYSKLEPNTVAPFGPNTTYQNQNQNQNQSNSPSNPYNTPRGRGSYTPRGRGRGFGNGGGNTPGSGSRTPINGESGGFRRETHHEPGGQRGKARGGFGGRGGRNGAGAVVWGGGSAPIFVKAGELFKEGEVDIVTVDKENHVHIDVAPLSDPSVPQMRHLQDEHEVEIVDQAIYIPQASHGPRDDHKAPSSSDPVDTRPSILPPSLNQPAPIEAIGFERMSIESTEEVTVIQWAPEAAVPVEDTPDFYIDTEPQQMEVEQSGGNDPFFIDIEPTPSTTSAITPSTPAYHTSTTQPLGHHNAQTSDEETILIKPRTYREPEPINLLHTSTLPTQTHPKTAPRAPRPTSPPRNIFIDPRTLPSSNPNRASKKAAKREKRIRNKTKRSRGDAKRRGEFEGDDLDWGSDEAGRGAILGVGGLSEAESEGDLEEVLRDYLEGTQLGDLRDREEREEEEGAIERRGLGSAVLKNEQVGVDEDDSEVEGGVEEGGWETESGDDGGADIKEEDLNSEEEGADVVDSEDDEDSSELGDLRAALDRDSDDDCDDSDEDVDKLFSGKDNWDETDWFIRNMEEALDPLSIATTSRKSRNALFHQIQDGSFDLPIAPTKKKGKSKAPPPHVPLELHQQWEKDRESKAEKRKTRELERLLAEIDPYRNAKKGKGKGKGKEVEGEKLPRRPKGVSKIEAAKLAHLIPASASKVAEMFDISDTDEDDENEVYFPQHAYGKKGKMGKMRNLGLEEGGLLPKKMEIIDAEIREFLDDGGKNTFSLPPMDKEGRKNVHLLAECYGLGSKSRGTGHSRFTVLIKNRRSGHSINEDKIDRIINASDAKKGSFYKALYSRGGKGKVGGGGGGGKGKEDGRGKAVKSGAGGGAGSRRRDGELVGEGAERIGGDNMGHKLLSMMGWAEGDRIGMGAGLDNPIIAIVKNTKMGLGA